jgi:predicted GNAT family acetyltransferase
MAPPQQVRDNEERKRFEIDLGDGTFAFAQYNLIPGKIMFTHTEVPEAHGGKGIGTALIRAGLAAARERGLKVIPICPFFAAYMQKHEEVQELLDETWRTKFGLPPL